MLTKTTPAQTALASVTVPSFVLLVAEEWETYWEVTPRDQARELFGSELAGML